MLPCEMGLEKVGDFASERFKQEAELYPLCLISHFSELCCMESSIILCTIFQENLYNFRLRNL